MNTKATRGNWVTAILSILTLTLALPMLGQSGGSGGGSGGFGCPGSGGPTGGGFLRAWDVCATYPSMALSYTSSPFRTGDLRIQNLNEETIQFNISSSSPKLGFFPVNGTLNAGDQRRVATFLLDEPDQGEDTFEIVVAGLVLTPKNGAEDYEDLLVNLHLTTREFSYLDSTRSLWTNLRGLGSGNATPGEIIQDMLNTTRGLPVGKLRPNSNPLLTHRIPDPHLENTFLFRRPTPLTRQQLDFLLSINTFKGNGIPCGEVGPEGLLVCAEMMTAPAQGQWIILSQILDADVPLDDSENFYQYGFVFDSDGDESNNWVAVPQFANDYFQGTDRWYVVDYSPNTGEWSLIARQVVEANDQTPFDGDDNIFVDVQSAAFALVNMNAVTLFVPQAEFAASNPRFRTTSFRHGGDFGQNPPFNWSADFWPELDEPLVDVQFGF